MGQALSFIQNKQKVVCFIPFQKILVKLTVSRFVRMDNGDWSQMQTEQANWCRSRIYCSINELIGKPVGRQASTQIDRKTGNKQAVRQTQYQVKQRKNKPSKHMTTRMNSQ